MSEKMKVELDIACVRRSNEKKQVRRRVKDSYGLKRIAAMETEIRADYAAKMAGMESEEAMKETIARLMQDNR
jgi:hypothetical protein